jgi:hypothetical protein
MSSTHWREERENRLREGDEKSVKLSSVLPTKESEGVKLDFFKREVSHKPIPIVTDLGGQGRLARGRITISEKNIKVTAKESGKS